MASMVIKPPVESTAMPLSAAPLVQPRAICAPNPNKRPPPNAKANLLFEVIFGECCTLKPMRPLSPPEINAPIITPKVSNTNQLFIEDLSSLINCL